MYLKIINLLKKFINHIAYTIYSLFEIIFSIFGVTGLVISTASYNRSGYMYFFVLFNTVISMVSIFVFFKFLYNLFLNKAQTNLYLKIKIFARFVSFIWGTYFATNVKILNLYKNKFPIIFIGFINYFIISCVLLTYALIKIGIFIYKKRHNKTEYVVVQKVKLNIYEEYGHYYNEEYEENIEKIDNLNDSV